MSSYGLWLSAAGMKVNEHRQTILANNIANAHTTGFKHDLAVVRQRAVESVEDPGHSALKHPVLDSLAGGQSVLPAHHDLRQGAIEWTGRPLDAAIEGDGFFTVRAGDETRYTRDGAFTLTSSGQLTLSAGQGRWLVLDSNETPIRLDPAGATPKFLPDGTITQGEITAAKLSLVEPEHDFALRKVGENLFAAVDDEMGEAQGRIVGESLETSNFDAVQGIASMIEVSRAYEINARLLQLQDQATGQAVNNVGRIA